MLEINQKAPEFKVINQNKEEISLSNYFKEKNVVLYFYPKDDTPGCTIQANQFTSLISDFNDIDTIVFGISKDDSQSHTSFIEKFNLKIDLLADIDGTLCEQYGVWQEKEKNGVKKMGIVRSTFIINKEGKLKDVMYNVTPDGHAHTILDKLKA